MSTQNPRGLKRAAPFDRIVTNCLAAVQTRIESLPRPTFGRDEPPLPGEDQDLLHETLSTARRRETIRALDTHGALRLGELAEVVAVAVTDVESRRALHSDARKRVYISLYQTHIPKLDDAQITDWHGSDPVAAGPKLEGYADALARCDAMTREVPA